MGVLLALASALAYGTADFLAGLSGRRYRPTAVAAAAQATALLTSVLAVAVISSSSPTWGALGWGALAGIGSGVGTLALYHGLAVGRMSTVATVSAVVMAVLPVPVGLALGQGLSLTAAIGIAVAIPGIALVSWHPEGGTGAAGPQQRSSAVYGLWAGIGFALMLVALDRAGTHHGAWPLVPTQGGSLLIIAPLAAGALRGAGRPDRRTAAMMLTVGVLNGVAGLLFLAATGHGALTVVAVVTALYPAATVILARVLLAEHWTRTQVAGLITAAAAIVLVTL